MNLRTVKRPVLEAYARAYLAEHEDDLAEIQGLAREWREFSTTVRDMVAGLKRALPRNAIVMAGHDSYIGELVKTALRGRRKSAEVALLKDGTVIAARSK